MFKFMPLSIRRNRFDDEQIALLAKREWRAVSAILALENGTQSEMRELADAHRNKWGNYYNREADKV